MKNYEDKVQSGSTIKYFCPMKCEGSKTYDKLGDCPLCKMHMIPVDDKNQNTENNHGHQHNEHHNDHKH